MTDAERMRVRRALAITFGMCTGCMIRRARPGLKKCKVCGASVVKRMKQLREIAVRHGICTGCQVRKVEAGQRKCSYCHELEARNRRKAKAAGKCSKCLKRDPRPDRLTCQHCADRCAEVSQRKAKTSAAAVAYVKALRNLEKEMPRGNGNEDRPFIMKQARDLVQQSVRELFAAVENRT